ncbi:MAG: amidohydrolase [Candidatus Competibacteraceae bacterium]|nr:amidohydrolase [Candidatus Competibacteraceae bacterium]
MSASQQLHIAVLQVSLKWESVDENLSYIESKLDEIDEVDLVLLPEMFTTGFTMNTALCHTEKYNPQAWMRHQAKKRKFSIAGSYMIHEHNQFFNQFLFVDSNGKSWAYNKKHLFSLANENQYFSPGNQRIMAELHGWKIALFVCYDLRFPVWNCRTPDYDYDLALYTANWPERRSFAWRSLLTARAIENQSFIAAANRIGHDGNGVLHSGDSTILLPTGKILKSAPPFSTSVLYATLDLSHLKEFRQSFPFFNDRDSFEII